MRIALSSWTYPWAIGATGSGFPAPDAPLSRSGLLDRAAELGVGVVQFADNLPLDPLPDDELDAVVARADALGIRLEVGTRGIDPAHLARCVAVAVRVGSPIVRVVIDLGADEPTPAEAAERLAVSERTFRDAGVLLAIENHDRYSTSELAGLVAALGDWSGICLDTVNSFGALEGPDPVIDALAPLAVNVHVKDFAIERVPWSMGFTVVGRAVGDGRLDVPALLAATRGAPRLGSEPSAVIELWTPPGEDLAATFAVEDAWARRSVAALRALGLR